MAKAASVDVSVGDVVPEGRCVVPNFRWPPGPLVGWTLLEALTAAGPPVLRVVSVAVEGSLGDIPSTELVFRGLILGTTPVAARGVAAAGRELRAEGDLVSNLGLVSGRALLRRAGGSLTALSWVCDLAAAEVKVEARDDREAAGNSGPAESVLVSSEAGEGDGKREVLILETLVMLRVVGPPAGSDARVLGVSGASGEVLEASTLPTVPSPGGEGWARAEVKVVTLPEAPAAVFLGVMGKRVPAVREEVTVCTENVLEADP